MACIDLHQTGSVGAGSDHLQLIKFWRSCTPERGLRRGEIFWLHVMMRLYEKGSLYLLQQRMFWASSWFFSEHSEMASVQCLHLSERFFVVILLIVLYCVEWDVKL